jgi:hypothetical protein
MKHPQRAVLLVAGSLALAVWTRAAVVVCAGSVCRFFSQFLARRTAGSSGPQTTPCSCGEVPLACMKEMLDVST